MTAERVQNSTFTATAVGALASIIVWALQRWAGEAVPGDIAAAFTTVAMALFTHFVPDAK